MTVTTGIVGRRIARDLQEGRQFGFGCSLEVIELPAQDHLHDLGGNRLRNGTASKRGPACGDRQYSVT
jgi:hypothetical protein